MRERLYTDRDHCMMNSLITNKRDKTLKLRRISPCNGTVLSSTVPSCPSVLIFRYNKTSDFPTLSIHTTPWCRLSLSDTPHRTHRVHCLSPLSPSTLLLLPGHLPYTHLGGDELQKGRDHDPRRFLRFSSGRRPLVLPSPLYFSQTGEL